MDTSVEILGTSVATKLAQAGHEALLKIGSDTITREQLSEHGCYNYVAARRLSARLDGLGAKDLKDLFEHYPPREIALPDVGVISLAVLGTCFEIKGIGGSAPLKAYVEHHQKVITFHSIKAQVRKADEAASQKRKRRR